MQGEEESPHYVAAPGTNDSGGPKRTSSRDWGQHWLDLDRDYFRPVSTTDIENLRSQLRNVEEMIIEAEASSLFRPLGIASLNVVGQSACTKLQQQQQQRQQEQQQQEEVAREEERGLLPTSQEEAEENDASSVRLQPTIQLQPPCPPSDSSASTSSCSISDKENKAKRGKWRRAAFAGEESVSSPEELQRHGEIDNKKKGLTRTDSMVSIMEEDEDEDEDEEEETRSAFSREDEDDDDDDVEDVKDEVYPNREEGTQDRSYADGADGRGGVVGGGGKGRGGVGRFGVEEEEEERGEDADFGREIAYLAWRKGQLHDFLQGEVAYLLRCARLDRAAAAASSPGTSTGAGGNWSSSSNNTDNDPHHHHDHYHHHRHQHEHLQLELARQIEMLRGGSQWESDDLTCEIFKRVYR